MKETNNPLGQAIRNRRLELGLSLYELADRLDTVPQYISNIELGKNRLCESPALVKRIAKTLGMDVSALQELKPGKRMTHTVDRDPHTLGGFLTAKRQERSLTLRELSKMAGITPPMLSRIERNEYPLSPGIIDRLCGALKCSVPTIAEIVREEVTNMI